MMERMVTERNSGFDQAPQAAYDIALWQLTEQVDESRSFDTKAGVVVTVAAAFAGLFGAAVVSSTMGDVSRAALVAAICGGAAVLGVFGWTMFAFYRTVRPNPWARGPEPRELIERAGRYAEPPVRLWIAEALAESVVVNEVAARDKARWFRRELFGAMALGVLTVVAVLAIALIRAAVD
jgi:hypothetical protein